MLDLRSQGKVPLAHANVGRRFRDATTASESAWIGSDNSLLESMEEVKGEEKEEKDEPETDLLVVGPRGTDETRQQPEKNAGDASAIGNRDPIQFEPPSAERESISLEEFPGVDSASFPSVIYCHGSSVGDIAEVMPSEPTSASAVQKPSLEAVEGGASFGMPSVVNFNLIVQTRENGPHSVPTYSNSPTIQEARCSGGAFQSLGSSNQVGNELLLPVPEQLLVSTYNFSQTYPVGVFRKTLTDGEKVFFRPRLNSKNEATRWGTRRLFVGASRSLSPPARKEQLPCSFALQRSLSPPTHISTVLGRKRRAWVMTFP